MVKLTREEYKKKYGYYPDNAEKDIEKLIKDLEKGIIEIEELKRKEGLIRKKQVKWIDDETGEYFSGED